MRGEVKLADDSSEHGSQLRRAPSGRRHRGPEPVKSEQPCGERNPEGFARSASTEALEGSAVDADCGEEPPQELLQLLIVYDMWVT